MLRYHIKLKSKLNLV